MSTMSPAFKTSEIQNLREQLIPQGNNAVRLAVFVFLSLVVLFPDQAADLAWRAIQYKEFALAKIAFIGLLILAGKKLFWWV